MNLPDRSALNSGMCQFLDRATTPFHATEEMASELLVHGFNELDESTSWRLQAGSRYFVRRNQSSLIAWVQGTGDLATQGWRLLGAHTDSPCLKVKPNADLYQHGYWRVGVEVYGGVLLNPWFDRSLSLAGRIHYLNADNEVEDTLLDLRRAIATIPSLAIHLDREANSKRSINAQKHLPVLLGMSAPNPGNAGETSHERSQEQVKGQLKSMLNAELKKADKQIREVLDYELFFYDTQPAELLGVDNEFLASARLDNLLSCYVDLQALIHSAESGHWSVLVCNDHEEVGSQSASGAAGPFLQQVLQRIAGDSETYARAIAQSWMISTDNAHALHPNYDDRTEPEHAPIINAGPVIKINANQRYASNSETQAMFRALCKRAEVPVQEFVVRSDMGCGSTIGPITASELGIRTLDVGVPTFAMHSIRELAGADDATSLFRVLQLFYQR